MTQLRRDASVASRAGEDAARPFPDSSRPGPLEVACGLAINAMPEAPRLPRGTRTRPREAIDGAIRCALLRPPCLVSFSGGRDSSALLAAATALARREGLALPVPATHRFPGAPASREDEWQEELVRHLGLPDWERLTATDELDSIGPVAQAVLRRHGLLWPFNAHFHVPLFELASGGSFITGVGGDELLGRQRWATAQAVLAGRRRPDRRQLRAVGLAVSPRPVRRQVLARRHEIRWPWLHPHVDRTINEQRAAWQARTPLRWSAAVEYWWRSRWRVVVSQTLELLATDADTALVQPFLEPSVLAAAAGCYGVRGPVSRADAMRALFQDVLPEAVIARRSKSTFDQAFFAEHSRSFAREWSGDGVDASLVDADALALVWHSRHPDPRSFSLLQASWLAQERSNAEQRSAHG